MSRKSKKENFTRELAGPAMQPKTAAQRLPANYDRHRDLPKLLPIEYALLSCNPPVSAADLIAFLKRALRRERTRGISGHWSYDLGRHAALLSVYRAELALLVADGNCTYPLARQVR